MSKFLAPWDAVPWFQKPQQTSVVVGAAAVVTLCQANPMRVGLILSVSSGGSTQFGINSTIIATTGIFNATTTLPLQLTFAEFGPLVQAQWFAISGAGSVVSVIEVLLKDWPGGREEL